MSFIQSNLNARLNISNSQHANAYKQLRQARLLTAKRPFLARGITVKRCEACLLAKQYCMCEWLKPFNGELWFDVVLLMHRDEILKPTNSGRLMAEAFPEQCMAFEWSRLEPPQALLSLINDSHRQCAIVYPARNDRQAVDFNLMPQANSNASMMALNLQASHSLNSKRPTLLFLDGTWRQAARMFNHSHWLSHLPFFALDSTQLNNLASSEYAMRKASENSRLATAEAASLVLAALSQFKASEHLQHIFNVFNQHYAATRACVPVELSPSHQYLANC